MQPFRWWHLVSGRKLFRLQLHGHEGGEVAYAVDVRHWGRQGGEDGALAHLYRDGRHHARSRLPAAFPVEGGTIEVVLSDFGLRRLHYLPDGGAEQQLVPDPGSAAGRRVRLEREHPLLNRWIGVVSVVLLVVGIGLNVLQLPDHLSAIPPLAEHLARFESPIHLPLWLNIGLGAGAVLASVDRALRLRYHWLLDGIANN
ncbi:hypothetical protein [Auraticoccus monumenti]|uniref:hypothetical protein n=1 Tax=Auraticoccus monumenti TaxID=675864 RepID=UPI0018D4C1A8|nr:hypothetical protein [Auraticoccus monumenti]